MKIEEAIEILRYHNAWRRGIEGYTLTNSTELGIAIDIIIKHFDDATQLKINKNMTNFFYGEEFHSDLESLLYSLSLQNSEDVKNLDDDWSLEIQKSKLEKIFTLKKDFILNALLEITYTWEERFPEKSDNLFDRIKNAFEQSIDFDNMNSLLPELYYPNGNFERITKNDLIEFIK